MIVIDVKGSRRVEAMQYEGSTLRVTLTNGEGTYEYFGVPRATVDAIASADSVGRAYLQLIVPVWGQKKNADGKGARNLGSKHAQHYRRIS